MSGSVMSQPFGKLVRPGRDLASIASALNLDGRDLGTFARQWCEPGPQSRPVIAISTADLPAAPGQVSLSSSYTVPQGVRFTLRGIINSFLGQSWVEGSGSLLWTLQVSGAATYPVDYLNNLPVGLGSFRQSPFPIGGVREFEPGDVLTWILTSDGTVGPGVGQSTACMIFGWEYPQTEALG